MRASLNWAWRLWESITEPRHLKLAYLGIYALTTLLGIVTLLHPPISAEGPMGATMATVWACTYILGGVVGMITVLPGWWWAERILALLPIGLGMVMYLAGVLWHYWGGPLPWTYIGLILLASTPFLIRWPLIWSYSYEPRR